MSVDIFTRGILSKTETRDKTFVLILSLLYL